MTLLLREALEALKITMVQLSTMTGYAGGLEIRLGMEKSATVTGASQAADEAAHTHGRLLESALFQPPASLDAVREKLKRLIRGTTSTFSRSLANEALDLLDRVPVPDVETVRKIWDDGFEVGMSGGTLIHEKHIADICTEL